MTPAVKKEFVKKMAEAVVKKEPMQYNFKHNPSGYLPTSETSFVKDKFGKQMKLQKVNIYENKVDEQPELVPNVDDPAKFHTRQK